MLALHIAVIIHRRSLHTTIIPSWPNSHATVIRIRSTQHVRSLLVFVLKDHRLRITQADQTIFMAAMVDTIE
ncbi:hypothetical protein C1X20_23270 [Pseudomonas sp. FW305-3-2-15-C-LB3]|nr:hypothetical protein C1X22_22715 [Pseudomonas sp. DP16D-L5]PMV60186.1 hypothetical protein C1X20_23270 [Pseudomonas sp. FW305-3-2-15-C-LB3]